MSKLFLRSVLLQMELKNKVFFHISYLLLQWHTTAQISVQISVLSTSSSGGGQTGMNLCLGCFCWGFLVTNQKIPCFIYEIEGISEWQFNRTWVSIQGASPTENINTE